ncbi:hypothetical protein PV327_008536 [Microctonus hyperodae]|uniref:SCA7 domain-containing protein n=1 Tax=Microctonus hyperodae TaxID=165561 RepID=A0AA39F3B8_MICHY|nr:hypothetical protein PV327_008536 [Microctonus hyperodae]
MSGSDSPTFFHGQPWSSWIERIGRDKPLSDDESDTEPTSSVTRLSADDIDLYGFCPERDTFYGVVCEICNAIVKPQALIQHMESRHSSGTINLPPPSIPASKAPVKTPYCKVSKLTKKTQLSSQPSSTGNNSGNSTINANTTTNTEINHTSIKRNVEQGHLQSLLLNNSPRSPLESINFTTTNISTATGSINISSPIKSPGTNSISTNININTTTTIMTMTSNTTTISSGQQRRKRLKADRGSLKDREYDPNRHCGVWNEETGKPCTRSLTCKAHTVSLRRTVIGRSKSFDKLLADHRAAKELPNRTSKVTVTGTVTVSSASTVLGTGEPITSGEINAPGSPPVLSLPDTYPLPKAVDLLYRCLAPHGTTKPTKLEEDFVNEEIRLEEEKAAAAAVTSLSTSTIINSNTSTITKTMMTPISVMLPSLSPIATNNLGHVATLLPVTTATSLPMISASLPPPQAQLPNTVLEGEVSDDVDTEGMTLYSPVSIFKDTKSQMIMQLPRTNNIRSPVLRNYQQVHASMPSLVFDEQMELSKQQLANGKRINNHTVLLSPISRPTKRSKHEFSSEYPGSIQVEATATSTPYPHFADIAWSNCHPEPLAVSRWLRITSSRKQYNFNIH